MKTTFFASPERTESAAILAGNIDFKQTEYIKTLIDALPEVVAIVDKNRQIVFANEALLVFLGVEENDTSILGLRPGEAIHCVNAGLMEAGCGTSEKCRYCGLVQAVVQSVNTEKKVSKEWRVITNKDGISDSLDFRVTATPLVFKAENYTILTIDDISDYKRRNMLEHIFFHDIINIAGGLKGLTEMLIEIEDPEETLQNMGLVGDMSKELLDEIISQRALAFAEKGELQPVYTKTSSRAILEDAKAFLSRHSISRYKTARIEENAVDAEFSTDSVLLKRVMVNMLKNAIEASPDGAEVVLDCKMEPGRLVFSVQNPGCMPPNVQAQIFQRSFTTKGNGRGLGTYSIKLLSERYLKATVGFTSTETEGTRFYVIIPLL